MAFELELCSVLFAQRSSRFIFMLIFIFHRASAQQCCVSPSRPGIETASQIVTIYSPHGSSIILVLWVSNIFAKFRRGHPLRRALNTGVV